MNSFIDNNLQISTLGIIGGMGPLVDGELISLIRRHTSAHGDRQHIPILLDGSCIRPDRSEYLCGGGESPLPSLITSLNKLEIMGADVIAIPCNTAHYFAKQIRSSAIPGVTVIDMVEAVCDNCKKRGFKSVTLLATLGTYRSEIYAERLGALGIKCVLPSADDIKKISSEIERIKKGERRSIRKIIEKALCLSDGAIVGCTELSISVIHDRAIRPYNVSGKISDSLSVLAASCIATCKKTPIPLLFT